ncbi:hypothetical protein C0Z01_14055 [Photobacterium kishitanii]|uniref:Single-stranded DNA-binding protein n=1 Tax=Photobacterium kishitanii TaxID=318456 RepID=A0A2T3KDV3_9GAMM|nr:hypothetical protein [Photobacterium kishitanii]KJG63024.1 hypothetical protein UA42_01140 [Photobacterium kishitanii]KJG67964.1 hypothetical protein UA40_01700 [Photobacterium kishitanii]KJG71198.1 hypothetical protein UA41_00780 [Photobacterium kishitanii]OBU33881.1 hypothetical protein AYY23_13705 [Photobacterium kishitanii]PSU20617.1 hypothetical protein CTM84_12415 [Photobacterium kishitanii]
MIVLARINDKDDIEKKTNTNTNTGESRDSGIVKLQLFNPSEVVEARISPELWDAFGGGSDLVKLIDKKVEFKIQHVERSFAGDGGKHVSFSGYHLLGIPTLEAKA